MPSVYPALNEVINPRSWLLPRFPNAHAQTATKPLVNISDLTAHVGIFEVFRPALEVVPQGGLALFIAHAVTPRSNLFEFAAQLGLALLMQTQTAFAPAHIEAVAKILQLANVGAFGLLAVDL